MKRRAFTLIELLVVVAILAALAALLWPVFHPVKENAPRSSCQSSMKQIGLAMMQYLQDYDERYPSTSLFAISSSVTPFAKPYGWADGLYPYVKSTQLFQCPSEKATVAAKDATQNGFTDYWINTNLSRIQSKQVMRPAETIMLGEGNDGHDGSDARYNRNVLPQFWLDDKNSPPYRHLETANYLFADGHVKAFGPSRFEIEATFALR